MLLWILLKGVMMGLAIAAPVGPIALLCIRRTLVQGRLIGLATGFGAATADGLYGMVAAFGLTALSDLLVNNTGLLQLIGGLFLCYLGLTTFFTQPTLATAVLTAAPSDRRAVSRSASLFSAYFSTLFLTLTNPATILSFAAIFAGLGITQTSRLSSVTLVFGVFTGSVLWWLVLVSGVIYLSSRLTPLRLTRFNRLSTRIFGVLIFGFGVMALVLWASQF
ncbi:MAG: putative threonine efflux protein [Phormidesmis priestleyi Ana]|uniref:Putative threonine efflux protein n=1 Tax=Phormidesmis priestleyi Ana TaxID=1666911 RepID=A0A0N8KMR0_9CYAN|nr:MAG: putative threonine efflux protein [Phormidesmis priestleyi Ana]